MLIDRKEHLSHNPYQQDVGKVQTCKYWHRRQAVTIINGVTHVLHAVTDVTLEIWLDDWVNW